MKDGFGSGSMGRKVSTTCSQAQEWFDRGLGWVYSFNHDEAVRCFENAIEADPECAMAHWGFAYAIGPNYNKLWDAFEPYEIGPATRAAFDSARRAIQLSSNCTIVEESLVQALQLRYQSAEPDPHMQTWDIDYADVMRGVYACHQDDVDVQILFAEALMIMTPWAFWDRLTGQVAPGAATIEAREVLELGIRQGARQGNSPHPALLHMYIHLLEGSRRPEDALEAADTLRTRVPDSGHLLHMASHIDLLCGRYLEAFDANSRALEVDRKYFSVSNRTEYQIFYWLHNYHFKVYSAALLARRQEALDTADEIVALLTPAFLSIKRPPIADWLESFVSIKLQVLVRFGMWQDILALTYPEGRELYRCTTVTMHYAKAVAHAAGGNTISARREAERFEKSFKRLPASRRMLGDEYRAIAAIERQVMLGEIEFREGNIESAYTRLRRAAKMQDNLEYEQGWALIVPARHALGALLLEQDRVAEAFEVYSEDLGLCHGSGRTCHRPDNVWSLSGIVECLDRMSDGERADQFRPKLERALASADFPVHHSCCCRRPT